MQRLFVHVASAMLALLTPLASFAQDLPEASTSAPNNIVGLNLGRLKDAQLIWAASDLVNANGGDWGYVTVTWTIDDRDDYFADYNLQQFLDRCFEHHVQPIIRLATRFDSRTGTWSKPDWDEPVKWRAFLERGRWPTRQVWLIAGNEPNLGREWGGEVDAASYARHLSHYLDVFADSRRFKIANAPLDISNGTDLPRMQDALQFIEAMRAERPDVFERLAAWASNPYRVPSGGDHLRFTHRGYEVELEAIGREMPVIITEAGVMETDDPNATADFFEAAFRDWVADPRVVAATPLFWSPDRNEFWMFSLGRDGAIKTTSPTYHRLRAIPRVRGAPEFVPAIANTARPIGPPAAAQPSPDRVEGAAVAAPEGEAPPEDTADP